MEVKSLKANTPEEAREKVKQLSNKTIKNPETIWNFEIFLNFKNADNLFSGKTDPWFRGIEIFPKLDCKKIVSANGMFEDCSRVKREIFLWNTENIKYANKFCKNCEELFQAPFLYGTILEASEAFSGCSNLTYFTAWNLSKTKNISKMFFDCSILQYCIEDEKWLKKPVWNFEKNSKVNLSNMFKNCNRLTLNNPKNIETSENGAFVHEGLPVSFKLNENQKKLIGKNFENPESMAFESRDVMNIYKRFKRFF